MKSIEDCAPGAEIIIYDDESDDPETRQVLQDIAARHEVRSRGDHSRDQHGALYSNMQRAFESVVGDRIFCFIQDDAQLIRKIDSDDHDFINRYFEDNPKAGFLASVFQRRITKQRTLDRFVHDSEIGVNFCRHQSRKEVAGVYYSDIAIMRSGRLREAGWRFVQGEFANELQAKAKFMEMGYMYAPFMMQLPNAPAYRNKKKTIAFRIAESANKAGLYPFRYMSEEEVVRLRERTGPVAPRAEDFLTVTVPGLKAPWIFHPLKRSRVLRRLDKLERFARSLLAR